MAKVVIVDNNGVPKDAFGVEREVAYAPGFIERKAHSHIVAFSKTGGLWMSRRSDTKAAWPGVELLFFGGGNANPEREGDIVNGKGLKVDYPAVAISEVAEELGVSFPRERLKYIGGVGNLVTFEKTGALFLKSHSVVYDPRNDGGFKFDQREVMGVTLHSDLDSTEVTEAARRLGEYGENLLSRIKEISYSIRQGTYNLRTS